MPPPNEILLSIAGAVADGQPVDWQRAETTPLSPAERSLLVQLRILDRLHRLHRSSEIGSSDAPDTEQHTVSSPGRPDEALDGAAVTNALTATVAPGSVWGRLEIRGVLGTGGFGIVYRAWDPHLASEVALKVLTKEAADGRASVIHEARLLARVRHPNIVSIYGADRVNGQVGLWMELVRGRTLRQVIRQQGPFGAREAALVGLDLTRALAMVHGAGLVHRDVKPHNVMRDDRGRIVLMDFGAGVDLETSIAGLQRRHVGTPLYMAPELFDHLPASPQTDLYSLGIVLYHLVTATYPLEGETPDEIRTKHQRGERRRLRDVRPDLPTEFVRIVERAIDPDVASRYKSAGEVEDDLAQFVVQDNRRQGRDRRAAAQRVRWRAAAAVALVIALLAAGVLGLQQLWSARQKAAAGSATRVRTVAVLPFANLSGDATQEYFADGMTDLLINELSMVSSLRVISRTSVMGYKSVRKPLSEVVRELNVDGVVEGSASRSGDQLRITARLVLAGSDMAVWGQNYERLVKDAFRLQGEIARDLADGIRVTVTAPERRRLQQIYAAPPEAQDLYLRGLYLMYQFNPDRMKEACDELDHAVKIDPKYAKGWSTLARCYSRLEEYGRLTPADARELVTGAAGTALAEDPTLAEAHLAWAESKFKFDWNWQEAERSYQQAINLNPSFSFGRTQHARFLAAAGHTQEAVREAAEAERTDPLSPDVTATLAMMTYYDRRYDDAIAHANRAIGMNARVGHTVRGRAYAAKGEFDDAIADLKQVASQGEFPALLAELGRTYAAAGARSDAQRILLDLLQQQSAALPPYSVGYIYAALKQPDDAFTWLERAVNERTPGVLWLRVDPNADPLRRDPRFDALVRRIGGLP
jgi:TolB-like protein/Tfp pilus assembly protein PilF